MRGCAQRWRRFKIAALQANSGQAIRDCQANKGGCKTEDKPHKQQGDVRTRIPPLGQQRLTQVDHVCIAVVTVVGCMRVDMHVYEMGASSIMSLLMV